jgi:hypothetical protein
MIYDKNNKYLRIFIINHKNTLNIIYLVGLLLVANKRFMKIFAPPVEKFSWRLRVTFKLIVLFWS